MHICVVAASVFKLDDCWIHAFDKNQFDSLEIIAIIYRSYTRKLRCAQGRGTL